MTNLDQRRSKLNNNRADCV